MEKISYLAHNMAELMMTSKYFIKDDGKDGATFVDNSCIHLVHRP